MMLIEDIDLFLKVALKITVLTFLAAIGIWGYNPLESHSEPAFDTAVADSTEFVLPKGSDSLVIAFESDSIPKISPRDQLADQDKIFGIRISENHGNLIDDVNASDGVAFILSKATSGTYVDRFFSQNWRIAQEKDFFRGACHTYIDERNPKEQAELFCRVVGRLAEDDIPPVLEFISIAPTSDITTFQHDVLDWLMITERETGKRPIIMAEYEFAKAYLNNPLLGQYALWISDVTDDSKPNIPMLWQDSGWTFWHSLDDPDFHGVSVGHIEFMGSMQDLEFFINDSYKKSN
ncbi:MAG: GH25 family lysozyme [Crocinitomicaceae bacterium]|nr:GH25 family lysozyme [Crocinitomicaceae bacterium]